VKVTVAGVNNNQAKAPKKLGRETISRHSLEKIATNGFKSDVWEVWTRDFVDNKARLHYHQRSKPPGT